MKQLGTLVNKDFEAIRKGGLYDTTPNGGTLHNIEDGKSPNEKVKEQDEEILPDAEPPKSAFSVDEAEKQKEAAQSAVREQREAEASDATMAEEEAPKAAEVFSVDGSEQL